MIILSTNENQTVRTWIFIPLVVKIMSHFIPMKKVVTETAN